MDRNYRNQEMATVVFMMGAPASGKSHIRNRDYKELPVVDADYFKENSSFYDPKNPSKLHNWSSQMAIRAFYRALSDDKDFIYDGTGSSAEKYVSMISAAHSAGFQVEVVYVKVTLETALARNAARERTVPEEIVREKHASMAVAVDIVSGYADSFRVTEAND